MKIDLVVNSMIQQADRSTQAQLQPQALLRTGEVLQGRVLGPGIADGTVQIRLNSGAVLNAVPAQGVQLYGGATVMLRVSSQSGVKATLQLLSQEVDNRGTATMATVTQAMIEGAQLARLGVQNTDANRRLLATMTAMGVPAREHTLARAADILLRLPAVPQEQAVFLAANGIAATEENLAVLHRLVQGQDLAGQLQALGTALQGNETVPAAVLPATDALLALNTQAAAQAAGTPQGQQSQAQALVSPNPATQAVEAQNNNIYDAQHDMGANAGSMSFEGQRSAMAYVQQPAEPVAVAPEMAFPGHATEALQLHSLMTLAVGEDGAQYAGLMTTLENNGLIAETVNRALRGMFRDSGDIQGQARAFAALLPPEFQETGVRFFTELTWGLRAELARMEEGPGVPARAVDSRTLAAELAGLVIALHDGQDNGARLLQAAAQRRPAIEHLAAQAQSDVPAQVAQQLRGIAENLKMAADINQYAYQQIPVRLGDRQIPRTVDLYVMKRGKGKRIDPENASILIALNTENLGRVETLIQVNQHSLRLRVGVGDAQVGEYIQSYTQEWSDAMEAIGYRLADLRMQVSERKVTPLDAQAAATPPSTGGMLNITL